MTGPSGAKHPSVQLRTLRVGLGVAAVMGVAYVAIAALVASVVWANLTAGIDDHLDKQLSDVVSRYQPGGFKFGPGFDPDRLDPRGVPLLMWQVAPNGTVVGQGLNKLDLPAQYQDVTSPTTATIDGTDYRLAGADVGPLHVVVGQSMQGAQDTESTLIIAELFIGLALLLCVFVGALAVGRRVAMPIELARRRQLDFTADASHELRTPLSVIEAQTSLARARKREADWDARAFDRIDTELKRTRRLVDDMLWLARFDATAGHGNAEPVDLAILAAQTVDRFAAVAESRKQKLELKSAAADGNAIVTAPPEWLDRMVGVLLDNALKYSPEGGAISVEIAGEGRRVRLTVNDSGPGIPESERERVFDRFHRATDAAGGAGLGLAIADAVVKSSGGRWQIGNSGLGGASISVSWPRSLAGHSSAAAG